MKVILLIIIFSTPYGEPRIDIEKLDGNMKDCREVARDINEKKILNTLAFCRQEGTFNYDR